MTRPLYAVFVALLASFSLLAPETIPADPVAVRHFRRIAPRIPACCASLDGDTLAEGDLIQVARGSRVTNTLIAFALRMARFMMKPAVFSQRSTFQLLTYHLVQKGPSFKHPTEVKIDVPTGQVIISSTDDKGIEKDDGRPSRSATGSRQWPGDHAIAKHPSRGNADKGVDARGHAQATPSEARDYIPGYRTIPGEWRPLAKPCTTL